MKKRICFLLLVSILVLPVAASKINEREESGLEEILNNLHWLGQNTFKITGDKLIYIDPYLFKKGDKPDLIFVTHTHFDHYSTAAVKALSGPDTTVIGPKDVNAAGELKVVKPGDKFELKGIGVEVVHAYNIGKEFHTKSDLYVGYILTVRGKRIYIAGDTDRIPEMKSIKADIAILPVGGTYTMTAQEAAQAALDIGPKIVIPSHYGRVVGSAKDAQMLKELLEGKIDVVIKTEQ